MTSSRDDACYRETTSTQRRSDPPAHAAFTLVELLVVIAIIAMMVASMLPAIQAARASARQSQCKANLVELVMALQNFEMAHTHFPSGVTSETGPIISTPQGKHQSWLIGLLPYLDESTLHRNIDLGKSVYDPANQAARRLSVPSLLCPSDGSAKQLPHSNYAGCHHDVEAPIDANNNGVLFLNSQIALDDIRDGLSQTLVIGELRFEPSGLGWMSGTRSTLRNTGTPINVDHWKPKIVAQRAPYRPPPPEKIYVEDFSEEAVTEAEEEASDSGLEDADSEDQAAADLGKAGSEVGEAESETRADAAESNSKQAANAKPPNAVGGFASEHSGGAHVAFADGRIQFMSATVSAKVLQQLGHRDDGQLLDPNEYRE